jgi:sigma-E factor negative regulatory protein RseC
MLEEQGVVVAVDQQFASVRIQRQNSCGHCAASGDCGTAHFSKLFGQKYTEVKVLRPPSVNIGDQVTIGFQEQALLKGALVLYLLPLVGLLAGGGCYEIFANDTVGPHEELFTALFGLLGFVAGLLGVWSFSRKTAQDARYQPVILRTHSL